MSQTSTQAPLHLLRLEVSNFMRVSALTVDCDGKHVMLSGSNGVGKSSCLGSIWAALQGQSVKDVPEPVKKGADKASVRLDLGEYIVERRWSESGTRLIVSAADGSKVNKPQQLLDGLLGKYALDPIAFLSRRPQDQVDDVLAICGVGPPVSEVKEITGDDHPPRPGESAESFLMRLSADDTGTYYFRRREAHGLLTQKKAALAEQEQRLAQLGGAWKPGERESSATALLAQIDRLQAQADERRKALQTADDAGRRHQEAEGLMASLQADRAECRREVDRLDDEIAELTKRRSAKVQQAELLDNRINLGSGVVLGLLSQSTVLRAAAEALPDHGSEITKLRAEVGQVEAGNRQNIERQLQTATLQTLAKDAEMAEQDHQHWDHVLSELRALRAELLQGLELGVPGLEVGDGQLRLDGVSFRQASLAQRIRVACAVAFRQNPRLKLLRLDEIEHLDSQSRRLLLELANENGWQCLMAAVSDAAELKVEIVEARDGQP